MPLVKYFHITCVENADNLLKVYFQYCKGNVNCADTYREIIYINSLHIIIQSIGLYHEDLKPDNIFFQ